MLFLWSSDWASCVGYSKLPQCLIGKIELDGNLDVGFDGRGIEASRLEFPVADGFKRGLIKESKAGALLNLDSLHATGVGDVNEQTNVSFLAAAAGGRWVDRFRVSFVNRTRANVRNGQTADLSLASAGQRFPAMKIVWNDRR